MEEKTLFALRTPEIGQAADETQTVVSNGGELLIKIQSRKQKIVNGKVVETTTPSCKVTMGESWLSSRVGVDNQYNILDVYFNIEKNTSSSERISVITVTQNESGKELIIHIIQKSGVTYTGVIEIPQFYAISLNNKAGASTTFEFTSYLLGSDGSKVAEKPSVSSLSSWLEVTSVEKGSSEHSYVVTFTANSSHSSNLSRMGEAVIHCGTASKNINVSQLPQLKPIKKQFTLTGLPLNNVYLFASGNRPQSGPGSISGYLMISRLEGSVTLDIPVTVNLSSYGDTTEADTGDRVTVWTSSGSSFSQIGSFTVPSAGGTVSI